MGRILDLARADTRRIINSGGFEVAITLTPPTPATPLTINGLASKHWITIETDGIDANTKQTHISISEKDLTDNSYPVRDSNGQVSLKGHLVNYIDSTGIEKTNVITEYYPDETLGIIVCVLSDYNE